MDPIRVAVIGLGGWNPAILRAVSQDETMDVVGVSEYDPQRLESFVAKCGEVEAFGDSRQMVLQTKPDVVFLSIPPASGVAALEFLAAQGIAVFKPAPLARNLTEAAQVVRMFRDRDLPLGVGNPRRAMESYRALLDDAAEGVSSVRAELVTQIKLPMGWRGDCQSAGGGVLLYSGLEMLDILIEVAGLPESVYAAIQTDRPASGDTTTPVHDTDDTVMAVLHSGTNPIGQLYATRRGGESREWIESTSSRGTVLAREAGGDAAEAAACREALAFAHSVAAGEANSDQAARLLLAHATVEAMYLSAQTQRPESPYQQLQIHGVSLEQCYPAKAEE